MKKLPLLWILLFTFPLFAQDKPVALKFDEVTDYLAERFSLFYKRADRFGERLRIEPKNKNVVIIYYNPRKGTYPLETSRELAEHISSYKLYFVEKERIKLVDGGYREYPTLEFWIAPPGAEIPAPTPTFTKDEIVYCPEINVAGDGFRKDRRQPLKFSVVIKGEAPDSKLSLEWNVSAGKIIKGQNTNQIEIDLSETNDKFISASVQVSGLHPECDNRKFASTQVGFFPYKVDEIGFTPYSDVSARLDGFLMELNAEPSSTAYIIIYASRDGDKKTVARYHKTIHNLIEIRRFDISRITIVEGGFREEFAIEFYLIPAGAEPPKPTPTFDSSFVVQPKKVIKKRKKGSK
jgi:hypothetical protein